jgi:hypothetical protein
MDGAEFSRALAAGLGRALRDARSVPTDVRRACLLEACIRHRAWDPQLSTHRGRWLARVLEAGGDAEALAPRILAELAALPDEGEFHHDVEQIVEIALLCAQRGLPGARGALYAAAEREHDSTLGAVHAAIVELDRIEGLAWIARKLGARARADAEFTIDAWMVFKAQEELGEHEFDAWLERAAAADPDIAAFRDRVWPGLEEWRRPPTRAEAESASAAGLPYAGTLWWNFSFADARRRLLESEREGKYFYWMAQWGKYRAGDTDVEAVLAALAVETDPRLLIGCLRVFQHRPMPRLEPRVIELLDHEDDDVAFMSHVALAGLTDERVRRVALRRIASGSCAGETLMLLRSNFSASDADGIRNALPTGEEPGVTHDTAHHLLDILERHATSAESDLLEWCFEWAACENCRQRAIERLQALSSLSPALADEARYDACSDVRAAVEHGPVPVDAPLPPE